MKSLKTNAPVILSGGYQYPMRTRTQKPTSIPEPFRTIYREAITGTPFSKLPPHATNKNMMTAFVATMKGTDAKHDEWNMFLRHVFEANVEVRTDQFNSVRISAVTQKKMEELAPLIPRVEMPKPTILEDWNLMAQESAKIRETMDLYIRQEAQRMVLRCIQSLDEMCANRCAGIILWHPDKATVCEYQFHRFVVVQEMTGQQTKHGPVREVQGPYQEKRGDQGRYWEQVSEQFQTQTTSRNFQRTHRNARHVHQLYDAFLYKADDRRVEKPMWIERFLDRIPSWIFRHIEIAAGEMQNEFIVEMDARVENWTEKAEEEIKIGEVMRSGLLASPAVCLGHWVLSGWSGADLDDDRAQNPKRKARGWC